MKNIFYIVILIMISASLLYSQGGTNPVGFGDIKWQTSLEEAKGKVLGEILYTDEKRTIDTKDGDISYHYGFFYVETEGAETAAEKTGPQKPKDKISDTKLFYVTVKFPYLTMEDVRKKLEEKYGQATGQSIRDYQGAIIWDSEKTTIVMWVYRYEKKPFCSKINYIGKELAKEINDYQEKVFNKREIEILKNLSL